MSVLRQARLVESRKEGRWIHYRLAEREATPEGAEMRWTGSAALSTQIL